MAWDVPSCERMLAAPGKTGKVLEIGYQRFYNPVYQAAYEGVVKAGVLGRPLPRPARVAPQRELAPLGRAAEQGLRPVALGLSRLRAPAELAAVLALLEGAPGRAGQPPGEHRELVLRRGAGGGAGLGRRLPVQGRPRGAGPRLHDLRLPGRPHGHVLLHRVQRLRQLLRDLHGDEGHADHARGDGGPALPRGRRASTRRRSRWRRRRRGGPALDASESKPASATSTAPRRARGAGGESTERGIASRNEIARWAAAIRTGAPLLCGPEKAIHSAKACIPPTRPSRRRQRLTV